MNLQGIYLEQIAILNLPLNMEKVGLFLKIPYSSGFLFG